VLERSSCPGPEPVAPMPSFRAPSEYAAETPFCLQSVDEVPAPEGQDGVWQRYVITQGANTIVGMRAGMHSEVCALLAQYVERLNSRFSKQQSKAKR
jgi:hypothetical protein